MDKAYSPLDCKVLIRNSDYQIELNSIQGYRFIKDKHVKSMEFCNLLVPDSISVFNEEVQALLQKTNVEVVIEYILKSGVCDRYIFNGIENVRLEVTSDVDDITIEEILSFEFKNVFCKSVQLINGNVGFDCENPQAIFSNLKPIDIKTKSDKNLHNEVSSPSHYKYEINGHKVEVMHIIDGIMEKFMKSEKISRHSELVYLYSNAIKYLMRWHSKNGKQDLEKSSYCINEMIKKLS